MTTLDELLSEASAEIDEAAAAHGPVDDALARVDAATNRVRRRTRITTAAAVVILLVAATALAVAAQGRDPELDVSGSTGPTSAVSTTGGPTTAGPAVATTVAIAVTDPTTVVDAPTSVATTGPPTTTPSTPITSVPRATPTTVATPVSPPTSNAASARRPPPGAHPGPLPSGPFTGDLQAAWHAAAYPRYTMRIMSFQGADAVGPLDVTVEGRFNEATVVAIYDPNAGIDIDPAAHPTMNLELIYDFVFGEFHGCGCYTGTVSADHPGVLSELTLSTGTTVYRWEISGFWLD